MMLINYLACHSQVGGEWSDEWTQKRDGEGAKKKERGARERREGGDEEGGVTEGENYSGKAH